jgi:hypothetical protein
MRKHTKKKVQTRSKNQSQKLSTPTFLDSKLEDASRDSL